MEVSSTTFFIVNCAIIGSSRSENIEHQPVLDEGDPAGEHADHPQLQGLEPGQRDGPPAPEQGDDAHEGQR